MLEHLGAEHFFHFVGSYATTRASQHLGDIIFVLDIEHHILVHTRNPARQRRDAFTFWLAVPVVFTRWTSGCNRFANPEIQIR